MRQKCFKQPRVQKKHEFRAKAEPFLGKLETKEVRVLLILSFIYSVTASDSQHTAYTPSFRNGTDAFHKLLHNY